MPLKILIISKYASSKEYGFETRLFAIARRIVKTENLVTIISSDSNHFGKFPKFNQTYTNEKIENRGMKASISLSDGIAELIKGLKMFEQYPFSNL